MEVVSAWSDGAAAAMEGARASACLGATPARGPVIMEAGAWDWVSKGGKGEGGRAIAGKREYEGMAPGASGGGSGSMSARQTHNSQQARQLQHRLRAPSIACPTHACVQDKVLVLVQDSGPHDERDVW